MSRQPNPTGPVGDPGSRTASLYVLCLAEIMILLDTTIVNVALPSIRQDLGFAQHDLTWVVNAYLIPFGGLLLLAGRLGDLVGQRRVFLAGVAVFTVASVLCAAAQTQLVLIGARFLQGVGGALTTAVILSMIVTTFPEPRERAKAIGVYGFVTSAGGSLGLVAGGALTSAFNWHWIFLINLPVGVATVVLALRFVLPHRGIGLRRGADAAGAALLTGGLMLGVYTILQVGTWGWGSARTIGLGAASVVLVTGFVVRQLRAANPLMPLGLFGRREVGGANLIQLLMVAGMFGVFFFGALYLQQVLDYDPMGVGLAFLPAAATMAASALWLSGPVILRFGLRTTLVLSLTLIGACLLVFARTPVAGTYAVDVLPAMILFGLGGGIGFPALMALAMSGVAQEESGAASGLVSTTYQVGGAIGLAALSAVAAERTADRLDAGEPSAAALNSGFQLSHGIGAVLAAIAIALTVVVLRGSGRAEPEGEHAALEDGSNLTRST